MAEPIRSETQLGLADLKRRFSAASLQIVEQHRNTNLHRSTYLVVGTPERNTHLTISDDFLDDLPKTKDYHAKVESYAAAVAGRIKCGSPDVFYCLAGIAIVVSIEWPIRTAVLNSWPESFVAINIVNQVDGQIAKCSVKIDSSIGQTIFDILPQTINSVRLAVDDGSINFFKPDVRQKTYQTIRQQNPPTGTQTQTVIEEFLAGKAHKLGYVIVDELTEIWAGDPWDAQYLGVPKKELLLAMRLMRLNGLFDPGRGNEYVLPSDKLIAQQSSTYRQAAEIVQPQKALTLPNKDILLSEVTTMLGRNVAIALIVIDLDEFKSVNDTHGHLEGDACLVRVVSTIVTVIGVKGKLYRWGGDEFVVALPDFSTEEAQVTAERIRVAVEQAKLGGNVAVTASIGVCGNDRTDSKSGEEILAFADQAMYQSKQSGKNRVTTWPFPAGNS